MFSSWSELEGRLEGRHVGTPASCGRARPLPVRGRTRDVHALMSSISVEVLPGDLKSGEEIGLPLTAPSTIQ